MAAALPVDLELRVKFNPNLNKSWFGGVMQVINQVTMLSIVLTGAALIREREHGTIEHLLVMPVTSFEIMTSKVWTMALVGACRFSLFAHRRRPGTPVPIAGSQMLFLAGTTLRGFIFQVAPDLLFQFQQQMSVLITPGRSFLRG